MGETKKGEMELSFTEGEKAEQGTDKGKRMEDVQEQESLGKDTELLRSIDQKLDLLLAAQNIS